MPPAKPARTIVFDLDGTLIDTAPDLIGAVNHVVGSVGGRSVAEAELRPAISFGGRRMIRTALELQEMPVTDAVLDDLFARFVAFYGTNIARLSQPFAGLAGVLDTLERRGDIFAVCTNKLEGLTWPLLEELGLAQRFAAVAGRDTFPVCKPDPRHLLGTIARAGGRATDAIMIGDSNTDIKTAKAAGVPVVGVTFGYTDVPVTELGCDAVISHYDQLIDVLDKLSSTG